MCNNLMHTLISTQDQTNNLEKVFEAIAQIEIEMHTDTNRKAIFFNIPENEVHDQVH